MKLNQKGFSLVEIIIVTAVAGAIILVISNIPTALRVIGTSNNESLAKQIVAEKIENLRSDTYDNLANGTTQINDRRLTSLPSSTSSVEVADCPVTVCQNGELIKQVVVIINWKEGAANKMVKVTTLIARGGLQ